MKRKVSIILSKKENNQVVTNMYLNTILKMMVRNGFNHVQDNRLDLIDKKSDFLIFDTCKEAFKFWLKGYKNIIIWIQGVVPEERIMMQQPKYKYYIHSFIEKIILKKATFLFMVSSQMLNHYEKKYGLTLKQKSYIMPCYNENEVDINSFENNKKYKNNTFLYVGSLQEWQCFEETVEVYKKIESKICDAKLIVYTDDKEKAKAIIEKSKIKNYYINYASAKKLGELIKDFKFGFVLRKDNIVNEVATPTKISNYLSHGIIPIYSPCLKSFDDYNKKLKVGIPLNLDDVDSGINKIIEFSKKDIDIQEMKELCIQAFNEYYNQNKYIIECANKMKKQSIYGE